MFMQMRACQIYTSIPQPADQQGLKLGLLQDLQVSGLFTFPYNIAFRYSDNNGSNNNFLHQSASISNDKS